MSKINMNSKHSGLLLFGLNLILGIANYKIAFPINGLLSIINISIGSLNFLAAIAIVYVSIKYKP